MKVHCSLTGSLGGEKAFGELMVASLAGVEQRCTWVWRFTSEPSIEIIDWENRIFAHFDKHRSGSEAQVRSVSVCFRLGVFIYQNKIESRAKNEMTVARERSHVLLTSKVSRARPHSCIFSPFSFSFSLGLSFCVHLPSSVGLLFRLPLFSVTVKSKFDSWSESLDLQEDISLRDVQLPADRAPVRMNAFLSCRQDDCTTNFTYLLQHSQLRDRQWTVANPISTSWNCRPSDPLRMSWPLRSHSLNSSI